MCACIHIAYAYIEFRITFPHFSFRKHLLSEDSVITGEIVERKTYLVLFAWSLKFGEQMDVPSVFLKVGKHN